MNKEGIVLPVSFYNRSTIVVARDLVGKSLLNQKNGRIIQSLITEVEAYDGPNDLASHAANGRRTARNEIMYSSGGNWYVYLVYGLHYLLNISCGPSGYPAAVLIRSVVDASGPGRLTKYFGIDRSYNNQSVNKSSLVIVDQGFSISKKDIIVSPRIGVDYAGEIWQQKPFRFYWRNMIK